MLGVFRCDVDGLGATLARGLGEDVSLARLATMSWLLDTFFAGRLGELVESDPRLYPVYGGGDDACVVGAWDAILDFALQVHEEFATFTGGSLTISAGVAFSDAHEPFYRLAGMAGEAEESAKRFARRGQVKDAVSVLGHAWDWDEFAGVWREAREVAGLVNRGLLPRGFLQAMQSWYAATISIQARRKSVRSAADGEILSERAWIGRYQLARLRDRVSGESRNELDRLVTASERRLTRTRGQLQISAIARFAEWLTRKEDRR